MVKTNFYISLFLLNINFIMCRMLMANPIVSHQEAIVRNTFKISSENECGTVFILIHPYVKANGDTVQYPILFTANHVLDSIPGDSATLITRYKVNDDYVKYPLKIQIRNNGTQLWIRHPEVDLAALRINLPRLALNELVLLPTNVIATDENLESEEIGPGENVLVLGFPLCTESNAYGFPIVRAGYIASYPLTPVKKEKTFLIDFEVFGGNSGSPVMLHKVRQWREGKIIKGLITTDMLVGIVTDELSLRQRRQFLDETIEKKQKLALAVVVQAYFLKELLNSIQFSE